MSKRKADPEPKSDRPNKKQKDQSDGIDLQTPAITTKQQLIRLLTFRQDALDELNEGLRAFRTFLESILYAKEKSITTGQQRILKDYLQAQVGETSKDSEPNAIRDLIQTWNFASYGKHGGLVSLVTSVIALLVRTISTLIDFRDEGLQICRTILQKPQLKMISQSLSSPSSQAHLISPCLRLLTEIVSFDGGVLAADVFRASAFTLDVRSTSRNLSLWHTSSDDPDEIKRRPSVRTNAVRLLMTHLKFQNSAVKTELLRQGQIFRSLFEHVKHDPGHVLKDILESLSAHVIKDEKILRVSKNFIWTEQNLVNLARVYKTRSTANPASTEHPHTLIHKFLLQVCCNPKIGLLRAQGGWYPPGTHKEVQESIDTNTDTLDLGLASLDWFEDFRENVPVLNETLSKFAQGLNPYANEKECELLLRIFKHAPELVADYFLKKEFPFDPKLSLTWIGFASFIFQVVHLPVPAHFGQRARWYSVPPPTPIVIENILPQPLSQKELTRCLNQSSTLVTYFTVQVLVCALEKLEKVIQRYRVAAAEQGSIWEEAVKQLKAECLLRLPRIRDIFNSFNRVSNDTTLLKEAMLRLLRSFSRILPEATLGENIDFSVPLLVVLTKFQASGADGEDTPTGDSQIQLKELDHLLQLAQQHSDVRWWHKSNDTTGSPFATLLKLLATGSSAAPQSMHNLLNSILRDHGILQESDGADSIRALLASFRPSPSFFPSYAAYSFLDDACSRLSKRHLPYEDMIDELKRDAHSSGPLSPVFAVLIEQWPFRCSEDGVALAIAPWLARYIHASELVGEDSAVLRVVLERILNATPDKAVKKLLKDIPDMDIGPEAVKIDQTQYDEPPQQSIEAVKPRIDPTSFAPPSEDESHDGLHRWSTKDIRNAISDGDLASLIYCLSSNYPEVRRQALTNLNTFTKSLDAVKASYENYHQYFYLIGILIATATPIITADKPLPYLVTTYAAMASSILQDPLHSIYAELNNFHLRSPTWDVPRLPSHWTHRILYIAPSTTQQHLPVAEDAQDENATHTERLRFLLKYIYESLRTAEDLEIVRKRGTLEPLLALANYPLPSEVLVGLARILWRVTWIEGGSTTLITRKGVMAWVGGRIVAGVLWVMRLLVWGDSRR